MENSNEIFTIPDFGTSDEIYNALLKLPLKYWKKLLSHNSKYDLLRNIFFFGDFDKWLANQIEATIYKLKNN